MKITGASDEALCLYNGLQDLQSLRPATLLYFPPPFTLTLHLGLGLGGAGYREKMLNLCPILHQRETFLRSHFQICIVFLQEQKEKFASYESFKSCRIFNLDNISSWFLSVFARQKQPFFHLLQLSFFLPRSNKTKKQREQAPQVRSNSIILILHVFRTSSTIFRSLLTVSHFYVSSLREKSNSSSHHHKLSTGGVFLSANPTKTNLVWYVQITSFLRISTNYSDVCHQRTVLHRLCCSASVSLNTINKQLNIMNDVFVGEKWFAW